LVSNGINIPENIAKKKKLHLVICIDEFQNCESFKESKIFQQKLRAEWQHHHNVTYCLYGSRQHMMTELFEKQSNPFFKFGDVLYLKIKKVLIQKELIDDQNGLYFLDPVYELWFKKYMLHQNQG
jgi:hypothetical protein